MKRSGHDEYDTKQYAEDAARDLAGRAHRPAHYGVYRFAAILLMLPSVAALVWFWNMESLDGKHPFGYAIMGLVLSVMLWRKSREVE